MNVDQLAQYIRQIDGKHNMGAGALAEKIVEWMASQSPAEGDEPVYHLRSFGDVSASDLEVYAERHAQPKPKAAEGDAVQAFTEKWGPTRTMVGALAAWNRDLESLLANVQPKGTELPDIDALQAAITSYALAHKDGRIAEAAEYWADIRTTLAKLGAKPQSREETAEPYGFEAGLVQLLNEARCLSKETVGNRELAGRVMRYIRMHWDAATPSPAPEPLGYKLVPVEPTQAMLDAVVTSLDDHLLGAAAEQQYREDWAAMLGAAPAIPPPAVPDGKVMVPSDPTPGLLMSMAIRYDHGLGVPGYYDGLRENLPDDHPMKSITHAQRVDAALRQMRKFHEEVVGTGFYAPEREAEYVALTSAKPPVQGSGQ